MNYEINSYDKVVNTNCTNCMICTEGCPTSALKFSYENPLKENYNLADFINGDNAYKSKNISNYFTNFRRKDLLLGIYTFIIGMSIDGLFGMGHFLSFGIAIITSYTLLNYNENNIFKKFYYGALTFVLIWSLSVKFSIHNGIESYENKDYRSTTEYLEFTVKWYPQKVGRYYIYLADSYYELGNIEEAIIKANISKSINPYHESVKQLFNKISNHSD